MSGTLKWVPKVDIIRCGTLKWDPEVGLTCRAFFIPQLLFKDTGHGLLRTPFTGRYGGGR